MNKTSNPLPASENPQTIVALCMKCGGNPMKYNKKSETHICPTCKCEVIVVICPETHS
jgi:hypothetical protein